ncbi:hypothetical protein NC652_030923 [Populus alba x Populus x berolinensis]|nr:hypothetical protein NC652_030923 [Populus alba x Populus x berolinensis]
MTNVSTPMHSFFALETFDSEFLKVLLIMQCFVMQKDIDAQESIENLPNLAKKIAIKCTVSSVNALWYNSLFLCLHIKLDHSNITKVKNQ